MWPFKRKPHVHSGYKWDNYYEWCRCGTAGRRKRTDDGYEAKSAHEFLCVV